MSSDQKDVQFEKGGTVSPAKQPSPKVIKVMSHARRELVRLVFGGITVLALAVAYIVALFLKVDGTHELLPVVGTGIGFLLGGQLRGDKDDS